MDNVRDAAPTSCRVASPSRRNPTKANQPVTIPSIDRIGGNKTMIDSVSSKSLQRRNTMKIARSIILALALLMTSTPSADAVQPETKRRGDSGAEIDLRPRFKVGDDVRFKMSMTSRTRGSGESAEESSQEMTLRFKPVTSDAEQGTTLEMTYESLKISMGDITFDSSKPADSGNPIDGILRSIVGLKMNVVMDANGNVTSVTPAQDNAMSGMLADQFTGADVIKGLFGPVTAKSLTTGRAKVGDSWKTEDSMAGALGGMKMAMTHTLESVRGGKARITTEGKVALETTESLAGGVRIKDSKINGTTRWDLENGMLDHMMQENIIEIESADEQGSPSAKTHSMKVEVSRLR
jgi:hypothetical protein